MEKAVMLQSIDRVIRQRNSFMVLGVAGIAIILLLSIYLVSRQERIIMVPGLNREVWVSGQGVSAGYLEEITAMYLPLLLDLNADSIDWKKELIFNHVSQSDRKYMQELTRYFAKTKEKYKKYSLSTHFAVKSFEVDSKAMTVKAEGQLTGRFGTRGYDSRPVTYLLSYEWSAGRLLLKEFVRLTEENEEAYEQEDK